MPFFGTVVWQSTKFQLT